MQHSHDFINALNAPDRSFGEVPFYWWTGDTLNRERLTAQLEALAAKGVAGVQVNYAHMNGGGEENLPHGGHGRSIPGAPMPFSEEWWEIFSYAAHECERLGMGIGVGDYTLAWIGNGFFTDKIAAAPGMGAREMTCEKRSLRPGDEDSLGDGVIAAVTYPDANCHLPDLLYTEDEGVVRPLTEPCEAYIVTARPVPGSIDPMHPDCGKMLADLFFGEFERRLPDLKPGTLNYFFQDELLFGCDVKRIWRDNLREGVQEKYGYDPIGFLPHLFYDLGDFTPKLRMDVADVRADLMEEGYFRPIYDFHASRGMIYGCDQSSRGKQPDEFGDYFRAVRWFTAPGNDTPGRAADLIKVKVNSSVAHLYERPRVWLEGYHSSGWGTTPESVTAPTSDNFLFGANLLNLHGLYYSTNGGFFEWAPPDFHFRMPYWDDMAHWLKKYQRMSALLTTGVHRCDAAIYYPVSSCDYGENAEQCVGATFAVAEYLMERGLDFDFIDHQSVERAACADGTMNVSGEKYRALLFCGVDCVRYSALLKAKELLDGGGTVIFFGIVPNASDRAGKNDPVLDNTVESLLAHPNCRLIDAPEDLLAFLNRRITRSFLPDADTAGKVYATKRVNGGDSLYFVRCAPKNSVCRFEATGTPYLLDAYTGEAALLTGTVVRNGFTFIKMPLEADADTLILFTEKEIVYDREINTAGFAVPETVRETVLDGDWDFSLLPTLDNTYGDFYLPAGGVIGPQARFFDCAEADGTFRAPEAYRFTGLPYGTATAFRKLETPGQAAFVSEYLATSPKAAKKDKFYLLDSEYRFTALELSDRYGYICRDDYETRLYEQGHHGLKGRVYDDNLFFREDCVFVTDVLADRDADAFLRFDGYPPERLYLNGNDVTGLPGKVPLKQGRNRVVIGFAYDRENCPDYRNRGNIKRASLRFAKTENPRKTGYPLANGAFANEDYYRMSDPAVRGGVFCYRFATVPGFAGFTANVFGEVLRAADNGKPMTVTAEGKGNFGGNRYRAAAQAPDERVSEVILFVKPWDGYDFTAALPEPFDLTCAGNGKLPCGDASEAGALVCYSGKLRYRKKVALEKIDIEERFLLEIGDAGATVKAEINGKTAAVFTCRPFTADITPYVVNGENEIVLTVSNTLCNHYATVPSFYSNFPRDAKSGLIGPVTIRTIKVPSSVPDAPEQAEKRVEDDV